MSAANLFLRFEMESEIDDKEQMPECESFSGTVLK